MSEKTENSFWYKKGLKDGIPIGLGYFAVAFSLGITAKKIEKLDEVFKFYLDGKKLQFKFDLNGKDAYKKFTGEDLPEGCKFEGQFYTLMEFNEKGYIHKEESKVHFNFEITQVGITAKGALNFEQLTTYNN